MANTIAEEIRGGLPMRHLGSEAHDLASAYDLQDAAAVELARAAGGIAGRKIAMNSAAMQQKFGVDQPVAGRVFQGGILANGAEINAADYMGLALEPEIGVVLSRDVPMGAQITAQSVVEYIAHLIPVFEILDRRNAAELGHTLTMVAYNISNAGCVMGEGSVKPDAFLPTEIEFTHNGSVIAQGAGLTPQDPFEAAAFVLNHFCERGEDVKAGEVILCGTHHPPLDASKGGDFSFVIKGMGAVNISIASA